MTYYLTNVAARRYGDALTMTLLFALFVGGQVFADDFKQPPNTEKSTTHSLSPAEVCKTVALPPGFHLSVFAAEPEIQNPIAIATDDRGRLWAAENYTWAGADAGNFDASLTDRVVIFDDRDGDGRADHRKVFFDRAKRLTSLQIGMGGVWLLCPPQLLFIPDANRDNVPDGPPQVVLDGFDLSASSHTVANGLKWGPDGWLYGRQGILGTSKIGVPGSDDSHRVTMNTGVWRYHPTQHKVEVVMHGMTNPWGFDYDAFGECFVTNTVIGHLWHVIPGAHTERMHGSDINPYAYQLISQTADHVHWALGENWQDVRKGATDRTSAAGGGHAHTGLLIYQGDNWPDEYCGRAYMINFHGRRLNCDIFKCTAAGYVATHGPDMCFIADPWFRGTDLISGADGGVFISDWSDTGECHEIGGVHRSSGRIYKLTYGKTKAAQNLDLAAASDEQLVALQTNANDWCSRRARLNLQERAAKGTLDTNESRKQLIELFERSSDPVVRVRALWALWLTNSIDIPWLVERLDDRDEHVRVWCVRFLTDAFDNQSAATRKVIAAKFVAIAAKEKSGLVLLYLASALQRLPAKEQWELGQAIAHRSEPAFAGDRTLAIMLWLGIEPDVVRQPQRSIDLLKNTTFSLLRENIARRLTTEIDNSQDSVAELLSLAATDPKLKDGILKGIAAALKGRKITSVPENWQEVRRMLSRDATTETADAMNSIGIAFRDPQTIAALRQTVEDSNVTREKRARALEQLLDAHPGDLGKLLRSLIRDPELGVTAIRGLAAYSDTETPSTLLDAYAQLTRDERVAAITTLASRAQYAEHLVDALEHKRLSATDLSAVQVRQIMALNKSSLSARLRAIWGDARSTSTEKQNLIGTLRATLTPAVAQADLQNGRALFTKYCATCHTLFGQGAKIGPDLTGSDRKNLDYLLQNIVDPSAIVPAPYRVHVFVLASGQVLTGIIHDQNDKTITIETSDGKQTIDRQNIDEMSASQNSLMPDGLLQPLKPEQIRDLIGYLMSNG